MVINQLARSTLIISQRAYKTGGVTNPPTLAAKRPIPTPVPPCCIWPR